MMSPIRMGSNALSALPMVPHLQGSASPWLAASVALWREGELQPEAGGLHQRNSRHDPHLRGVSVRDAVHSGSDCRHLPQSLVGAVGGVLAFCFGSRRPDSSDS